MSTFLAEMRNASLARLIQARSAEPEPVLWRRARDTAPAPALKLLHNGFDVIAECKLRSPSAGELAKWTKDIETRVTEYAFGGACAVSVLTENLRFGGSLDYLRRAATVLQPLGVPTMRKDFLLDPYQVMEARIAGAGGILVIVRMLSKQQLTALLDCAAQLHMFVLLEAFDSRDLAVVRDVLACRRAEHHMLLVGLNCRDLGTLEVDAQRFAKLAAELPAGAPAVAESGLHQPAQVQAIVEQGYRLALIGATLMSVRDPQAALAAFLAAGRRSSRKLHSGVADICTHPVREDSCQPAPVG